MNVADGDTITLLDSSKTQHKIRLDGIDAPERAQPFGSKSGEHLAGLVAGRQAVAQCSKRDRYGRHICRVLVAGVDANLAQIRAGMAWFYRYYADELPPDRRGQYADAESQAQADKRGLWTDPSPIPPWDWRRRGGK